LGAAQHVPSAAQAPLQQMPLHTLVLPDGQQTPSTTTVGGAQQVPLSAHSPVQQEPLLQASTVPAGQHTPSTTSAGGEQHVPSDPQAPAQHWPSPQGWLPSRQQMSGAAAPATSAPPWRERQRHFFWVLPLR
jgi:hypothetical protein